MSATQLAHALGACLQRADLSGIDSLFLYGSCARDEDDETSDIDIMAICQQRVDAGIVKRARDARNLLEEQGISVSIRLRDPLCLEYGPFSDDFGPLSLVNYLRDGIYLFGRDLSAEMQEQLRCTGRHAWRQNFAVRRASLVKRVRALGFVLFDAGRVDNAGIRVPALYLMGDCTLELAELDCFSHGEVPASTSDAIERSGARHGHGLFAHARGMRLGQEPPEGRICAYGTLLTLATGLSADDTAFDEKVIDSPVLHGRLEQVAVNHVSTSSS